MNRLFWIAGIVLLIGSLVGAGLAFNHTPPPTTNPESLPPPAIVAVGYVDGEFGVSKLYPLQPGRLLKAVAEGTFVKKGDPVLWLDEELASLKVKEAEADWKAAQAQLEQAKKLQPQKEYKVKQQEAAVSAVKLKRDAADNDRKSKEDSAKSGLDVNKYLLDAMRQTVQQLDRLIEAEQAKLDEIKLMDPKLDERRAESDLAAKKVRMDQAQWALDQCKLVAPADGTVLRVHVNAGEILGPNPTKPAVEFLPKGALIVRGEVLQEWASRVKLDHEVEIVDDTFQGPTWKGKVYFLSPYFTQKRGLIIEPFMYNDVRLLECLVRVTSEGELPLRVGQRVRVKIKS